MKMSQPSITSGREIESELKRRVAYLPGGRDRNGLPLIVVPISPPSSGLCSSLSQHSHPSTIGQQQHRHSNNNNKTADESFDSSDGLVGLEGSQQNIANPSAYTGGNGRTCREEEHCADLDRVLRYLLPIATGSCLPGNRSVVVLLDARQGCWRLLRASTDQVQATLGAQLAAVWAIKPEPFWEKQHVECVKSRQDFKIQYLSLAKLHKMVDLDQLPEELGGQMPYQHKQWVKNRLRLETFNKRAQMVLANLGDVRGQLERGCDLQKSDGGFRMLEWMLSLGAIYRNCLANVRKVEQNGRKLFKQLETDEESGFRLVQPNGSVTPYTAHCQRQVEDSLAGIRGRVGEAEQLYTELQGGIHHAKNVRRLEAGMEAVTAWVLGPGADLLRQLILRGIGQDSDSVISLQQDLENLELKCRETYAKYAEVRHRLGFLFRSRCPLPSDMKPRRSFMDSVCRTFAGLLERRRRVLITSFKFHRLLAEFHVKLADALRAVQNSEVGEDPAKAEGAMSMLDEFQLSIDSLCGEVESEAQRLLDLLVLPPRDAVGRELQGYDHRRERQHVQFLLRRVQDGQGRLQHAWSMERLRLRRIIEISTCERDSQQALEWLGDLCNVMKTSRGRVGCSQSEVQILKQQQSKFQETARGAYEYGMGLLMAALVLRRSAGLSPDRNRQLAAQLGSVWNRLLAAIREQMTRLRVAGLFYRDISQHEGDLKDLIDSGNTQHWASREDKDGVVPEAEQVFRTLGRTVRLGRLLQRKILEPLLPGEGFDSCPENQQAVQVISDCISTVTDLAHRLDLALGHHHQLHHSSSGSISGEYGVSSYVDAYMAEDSVFDMEEIDVQVGYETGPYDSDEQDVESIQSPKDGGGGSSKSSCYQSAESDCSWTHQRDDYALPSPLISTTARTTTTDIHRPPGFDKVIEQLDMKAMNDFRDYVNFTPSTTSVGNAKLFLHTTSSLSGSVSTGSPGSGSVGGLSPNSSEDSGFATTPSSAKKTVKNKSEKELPNKDKSTFYPAFHPSIVKKKDDQTGFSSTALLLQSGTAVGTGTVPRFRNSICYARSASCDSLF